MKRWKFAIILLGFGVLTLTGVAYCELADALAPLVGSRP